MKLAARMGILAAVALVVALHVAADQPSTPGKTGTAEVNVVLRISRKLVDDLTTRQFQRTDAINLCVLDQPIVGEASTDATFTVQFEEGSQQAAFILNLKGATTSRTKAERRLLRVRGSGRLDFTVRKRVTFDGLKFTEQPTDVDARFCSSVDAIETPPGLLGFFVEIIATPKIRRSQPLVAQMGYDQGRTRLVSEFDKETRKLIDELNTLSPLEKTATALFPATKDWIYYLSVTPTHLILGAGPADRRVPVLPTSEKTNAPIELWIRQKSEAAAMLQVLKFWKDAGDQLAKLLPERLSKELKFTGGFKSVTVGEWFVIQVGVEVKKGLPPEEIIASPGPTGPWRPASARPHQAFHSPTLSPELSGFAWRPATRPTEFVSMADGSDNRITVVWRPVMTNLGGPLLPASGEGQRNKVAPHKQ